MNKREEKQDKTKDTRKKKEQKIRQESKKRG